MGKFAKFKRILIANRGEIAVRIINTCREMGIETVIAATPADKGSLFIEMADYAHHFESSDLKQTYLNTEAVINIALKFNCDAIHPGYGFLSENATFARSCEINGINFIGPTPELIELMGDKIQARKKIEEIGIPLLKGYTNPKASELKKRLKKSEYPFLIKAAAGGGGRGMRIVHKPEELDSALTAAAREAENSFGDKTVYVERYLEDCRHIEVQVLSDSHGNHLHLFERECSIQRRHQKVIEEAPSSSLTEHQRQRICDAAVKITKNINYLNAGTMEFLWSGDEFFFLEMNTRLQVEHPVTEQITGIDIVKEQILIAEGRKLNLKQNDLKILGHAIEARIYAEDPANSFLPTSGSISHIGFCNILDVRVETSFQSGCRVPVEFDSMIAKISAHSNSRKDAAVKLATALKSLIFSGIINNRPFLINTLSNKDFLDGKTFTSFIDGHPELTLHDKVTPEAIAAFFLNRPSGPIKQNEVSNPWMNS